MEGGCPRQAPISAYRADTSAPERTVRLANPRCAGGSGRCLDFVRHDNEGKRIRSLGMARMRGGVSTSLDMTTRENAYARSG